jgi:hypothetical protein
MRIPLRIASIVGAKEKAMRIPLLIGSIVVLAGCAGVSPRAGNDDVASGRWQGVLLRNGLRAPIAVELSESGRDWRGRFSAGDNSVPLQDVRVTPTSVRFELPGEGTFEGALAGDRIAGSISGPSSGSFSLTRSQDPNWTIDFMLGP